MLEREFVSYEIALALKELGFDELVCGFYYKLNEPKEEIQHVMWSKMNSEAICHIPDYYISAPLYQQAFRWFREKCKLDSWIFNYYDIADERTYYKFNLRIGDFYSSFYNTYEEAELECIKKLIEIAEKLK